MIPLLRRLVHDFLFDADRAVLWLRGAIGMVAVGGVGFARELADALGTDARWPRIAAAVAGFIALGIGKGDRTEVAIKKMEPKP